jgi:hypothetical protein
MMGRATGAGKAGIPMLFCPNYDCPYRERHGRAAEYDDAEKCSDCGAVLTKGSALTLKEAEAADLGAPVAEPLLLPPSPLGAFLPWLMVGVAALVSGLQSYWNLYSYFGFSLVIGSVGVLRRRRRNAPRILPHERGFLVVAGDQRTAFPAARLTGAQVASRELRVAGLKLGYLHDLTLITGTQRKLFTGFTWGETAPFLDFARALSSRSSLR